MKLERNEIIDTSSVARIFQGGVPDFLFLKKSLKYNLLIKFLHFFSVIKVDSMSNFQYLWSKN